MTILTDRNSLITAFASSWSGIAVFYPGEEFEEPTPTGSIASPAAYQILEILYQDAERMTFGGTRIRRGSVVHNLWVERAGSDQKIIAAATDAIELWRTASVSGATFFPDSAVLGDPVSDGPWEGRALSVPFWLIEEPSGPVVLVPTPIIYLGNGPLRARLYNTTADSTPTELYTNGTSQRLTIEAGVTAGFFIRVVARGSAGAVVAHYTFEGTIQNNAGTTAMPHGVSQAIIFESSPAAYAVSVTADDANDALIVTVTGAGHWEADADIQRSSS